jgi:hypothetical protein
MGEEVILLRGPIQSNTIQSNPIQSNPTQLEAVSRSSRCAPSHLNLYYTYYSVLQESCTEVQVTSKMTARRAREREQERKTETVRRRAPLAVSQASYVVRKNGVSRTILTHSTHFHGRHAWREAYWQLHSSTTHPDLSPARLSLHHRPHTPPAQLLSSPRSRKNPVGPPFPCSTKTTRSKT